jgi:hypothetical protein
VAGSSSQARARLVETQTGVRMLRALRISSTCRYLYSFQPPLSFDKDLHTEVLLDFSAESGPAIRDLSGHNRDGRLMGGEWIIWMRQPRESRSGAPRRAEKLHDTSCGAGFIERCASLFCILHV